jgi:RNA polymerase sigma factor (sigma-70 family)
VEVLVLSEEVRNRVVQEIARHQSRLRGFARCLLVRPADVDDILQEINAVLWEKADEFQPGTDFWAWASQIARFKVLNHIRKLGRDRLVFDETILEQLAEKLKRTGYATGMIGKWHIGFREGLRPYERGFDYHYGFLSGAHSYTPGKRDSDSILRNGEPVEPTK